MCTTSWNSHYMPLLYTTTWQWTITETTRQQSSQQLLLPYPPSATSQSLLDKMLWNNWHLPSSMPRDSISDGLRQLHWLPIESRIQLLFDNASHPYWLLSVLCQWYCVTRCWQCYLYRSSFFFNFMVHSTETAHYLWECAFSFSGP